LRTTALILDDLPEAARVEEAAAVLNISPGLLRREIAAGRVRAIRFGRIIRVPRSAVAELLQAGGMGCAHESK
jgi:excisionase family DNA binding protein